MLKRWLFEDGLTFAFLLLLGTLSTYSYRYRRIPLWIGSGILAWILLYNFKDFKLDDLRQFAQSSCLLIAVILGIAAATGSRRAGRASLIALGAASILLLAVPDHSRWNQQVGGTLISAGIWALLMFRFPSIFLLAAGAIFYAFLEDEAAREFHIFLPYTLGYLALLIPPLGVGVTAKIQFEKDRRKIRNAFGRYLSKQVLETVAASAGGGIAEGRRKNITVLFFGIKDFNDLCRRVTPTELQKILNRFFQVIVDAAFKHGATLDKIMGGSMMVFFGDPIDQPDQHERAVRMAHDVVAAVKNNGLDLHVGVGIEYGEVVVGNLGGKEFVSYTCIGDRVNLAARLESMSKDGEILIGPGLAAQLPGEEMESLGEISIKGKQEPVEAFRLGTRLT